MSAKFKDIVLVFYAPPDLNQDEELQHVAEYIVWFFGIALLLFHNKMLDFYATQPIENYYFIYWFYRTEASTFAGDDVFGSANKERTERSTEDTDCVGSQRSEASSPLISSSPGG